MSGIDFSDVLLDRTSNNLLKANFSKDNQTLRPIKTTIKNPPFDNNFQQSTWIKKKILIKNKMNLT